MKNDFQIGDYVQWDDETYYGGHGKIVGVDGDGWVDVEWETAWKGKKKIESFHVDCLRMETEEV